MDVWHSRHRSIVSCVFRWARRVSSSVSCVVRCETVVGRSRRYRVCTRVFEVLCCSCICVLVCCVGCEAPHGAVSGFDPPGASEQSDDDSESDEATAAAQAAARSGYAPTRALPPLVAKAFRKAFGAPTVPRYGEPMAVSLKHGLVRTRANQAAWRAIAINLAKMHEYFDLYYYNLVRFGCSYEITIFLFISRSPSSHSYIHTHYRFEKQRQIKDLYLLLLEKHYQ